MTMVRDIANKKGGAPEARRRPDREDQINMGNVARMGGEVTLIKHPKLIRPGPAIEYAGTVEMTASEWATVIDNPRQRDTETRARRAKHLMTFHPSHIKVNMAQLDDGRRYKLDGHTRAFLWAEGTVQPPALLYVDVWRCRSVEDAKALYSTFDSRDAVETASDQVFGAKREHGVAYESSLLRGGKITDAMRTAEALLYGRQEAAKRSTYDLIQNWKKALEMLDGCKPSPRRFHAGIFAAALLTFRRYGEGAAEFWTEFAAGGGVRGDGKVDAVQALEERMERRRSEKRLTGRGNVVEIVGIAISAFERYRAGEMYVAEHADGKGKKVRGSGIKTTKGNSLEDWMIAAKNARGAL